jgi:hypothetical protein
MSDTPIRMRHDDDTVVFSSVSLVVETPSSAGKFDAGHCFSASQGYEMTRVEDLHADVRLEGYDDGVRGECFEKLHDDKVVLELEE